MGFIKYVSPTDFSNLTDAPVSHIKRSRRELEREDSFFEKKAALFDYKKFITNLKPGEIPLHVVALGCDEVYGPNRNGDAFTKEACRKYHRTFVKYGHWFRNHNHHDPAKSYGLVKDAAFNEKLGRIELLVVLNGTKEAAKRNGGLVADKELELLESEKDLPVSMACFADPNTPVLTETGYRPISQIQPGDKVINARGNLDTATEIIRYSYSGKLYEIAVAGLPYLLTVTEQHPFVAQKNGHKNNLPRWKLAAEISAGDYLATLHTLHKLENPASLKIEVEEIITEAIERLKNGLFLSGELLKALLSFPEPQKVYALKKILQSVNLSSVRFADVCDALNLYTLLVHFCLKPKVTSTSRGFAVKCSPKALQAFLDGAIEKPNLAQLYFEAISPDAKILYIREREVKDTPVWNLEVAVGHSYISAGVVSHNCKVAYDVCSGCGNKAKSRKYYCTEKTCKYGGLKENIGRTYDDGHILRAFNPEPQFFDISLVTVPADRIAYALGVLDDFKQVKKASAAPLWLYKLPEENEVIEQLKVLGELAAHERSSIYLLKKSATYFPNKIKIAAALYEKISLMDIPQVSYTLTKLGILLPIEEFLVQFAEATPEEAIKVGKAVRPYLADAFQRLLQDPDVTEKLASNIFYPRPPEVEEELPVSGGKEIELLSAHEKVGKMREFPKERLIKIAEAYALYQLASITGIKAEPLRKLAVEDAVKMNRV